MEKLVFVLVIALLIFPACMTKVKYVKTTPDGSNTIIEISRLPFVELSVVTPEVAIGTDTSLELNKSLVTFNSLLAMAAEMYAKYQIPGGAIAVPKAGPQATPPPAEVK